MNFIEESRERLSDGKQIVHSKAYFVLRKFEDAHLELQRKERAFFDAQKEAYAALQTLKDREIDLMNALAEHYKDDEFPSAMQCGIGIMIFPDAESEKGRIEVIQHTTYCDLYRIEEPKLEPEAA